MNQKLNNLIYIIVGALIMVFIWAMFITVSSMFLSGNESDVKTTVRDVNKETGFYKYNKYSVNKHNNKFKNKVISVNDYKSIYNDFKVCSNSSHKSIYDIIKKSKINKKDINEIKRYKKDYLNCYYNYGKVMSDDVVINNSNILATHKALIDSIVMFNYSLEKLNGLNNKDEDFNKGLNNKIKQDYQGFKDNLKVSDDFYKQLK